MMQEHVRIRDLQLIFLRLDSSGSLTVPILPAIGGRAIIRIDVHREDAFVGIPLNAIAEYGLFALEGVEPERTAGFGSFYPVSQEPTVCLPGRFRPDRRSR